MERNRSACGTLWGVVLFVLLTTGLSTSDATAQVEVRAVSAPTFLVFGDASAQFPDFKGAAAAGGGGLGYEGPIILSYFSIKKGIQETVGTKTDGAGTTVPDPASYGRSVLTVGTANVNVNLDLGVYPKFMKPAVEGTGLKPEFGFYSYFSANLLSWSIQQSSQEFMLRDVSVVGVGTGVSVMARALVAGNRLLLRTHVCFSMRIIGGDVGDDKVALQQAIGTTRTVFYGPELIVSARLRSLELGAKLMYYPAGDVTVAGLTNFRFLPMVTAVAPIEFPL